MLLLTVILYPIPNLRLQPGGHLPIYFATKYLSFYCIKKIRITPSHLTKIMKNIHKCTQVHTSISPDVYMLLHFLCYSEMYMRFLWSTTHGMLLHFLYCLKIWHLYEISCIWHFVTFPILLRSLTFTWNSFGQEHMTCCYISQKFDIYMKFPWSNAL